MQKIYIPVLLSGLVFPGAGQLYNGQKIKGIVYILLTLCGIAALVFFIIRGLWCALEATASPGTAGWDALAQGFGGYREVIIVMLLALFILWAAGILDAYLVARKGEAREVRRFIARRG